MSADSTTVVVQTVLEDFLKVSLRSIRFTVERFSGTSKTSGLGTTLLKCWINRNPKLLNILSKEFCCTLMMVKYPLPALLHSFLPTVFSYGIRNHTTPHMQCTAHSGKQLTQSALPTPKLLIACTYEMGKTLTYNMRVSSRSMLIIIM